MTHKKNLFALFLFALLLAACSMSRSEVQGAPPPDGPTNFGASAAPPMEAMDESANYEMEADKTGELAFAAGEDGFAQPASGTDQVERLIIRTGSLGLVVADTEEAAADITRLAERSGGWVVSANLYQYSSDAKSGDITIRVPAAGFVGAMEALKQMAVEVQSENVSGQDVTEEYVDLEARLGNLEATAVRVRSFLDDAVTVEEALAVNQELSRLEGEIEVIKGRMQYLSQSAAFSTITVYLTPDIAAQPVQVAGWRPQGVAKDAIEALINTLQGLANVVIWLLIFVLPVLLLIGIPVWLLVRFVRRRWR
ncbi:MAG: DUF4349 domain-containing protein, partial [Anaerolineae bacterium]|nr:DUF4349 domain-containing protein [Anaerolineae bacterium]